VLESLNNLGRVEKRREGEVMGLVGWMAREQGSGTCCKSANLLLDSG
jgi:hypothetical protein